MTTETPVYEALAAATLAAIDADDEAFLGRYELAVHYSPREQHRRIDRARVLSDLAGLREHHDGGDDNCHDVGLCAAHRLAPPAWPCPDAVRYAGGLRSTAALYGVAQNPEPGVS